MLFYILTILCFCIVLCIVSPFVYSCLFPIFAQNSRPLPPGGNLIAVNKYHIVSQKTSPCLEFIALYIFRIIPFDFLPHSFVFKTQQSSHTDSHATQTEGEAYNSVPVYLLITPASSATSIGTARITFCQREIMKNMLQNRANSKNA